MAGVSCLLEEANLAALDAGKVIMRNYGQNQFTIKEKMDRYPIVNEILNDKHELPGNQRKGRKSCLKFCPQYSEYKPGLS